MRKILSPVFLLLSIVALAGCGDSFPDEEMHFGIENKTRPYSVVIEPPEAAPGDTVLVSLFAQTPDADELDILWRVAQDFDRGMYEADEVERNFLALDPGFPVTDEDGFLNQSFQWVVPDSALLISSGLPEVLDDPVMVALAEQLIGQDAGSPPTKSAVDAWLKDLSLQQVEGMDYLEQMATLALADLFACQVRFRATMQSDLVVDVTRNLTIRHTGRLGGPNTNHNAVVSNLSVVAIEKQNATKDDLDEPTIPQTRYHFIHNAGRIADLVSVPRHQEWTYYLVVDFFHETYTSPFNPDLLLSEQGGYRWYYYRKDNPGSDHHFYVAEDGGDAEMWNLSKAARIMPAGVGSTFRIVSVVRDERSEWVMYNAVPGGTVQDGVVEFISP